MGPLAVPPPRVIPAKAGLRAPSRSGGPPRLPARVGVTRRSGAAFASTLLAPLPPRPLRRRLQPQRRLALHQLRQRSGDLLHRHVVLALVALDQPAEQRQVASFQPPSAPLDALRHPLPVHRFHPRPPPRPPR